MSVMTTRWGWFLGIATFGAVGSAIALGANCAYAQITPGATLPNNSTVKLDGYTTIIQGGTQAGGNLFHSFQKFSVPTGGTAFFNNAADIQNIFSRVTGGSVSNIDGLIKANRTANLFLINPNGIIFGPNASLNVGGSFIGTTANAIQFGQSGFFSATNPEAPSPLLTISVPTGLQFGMTSTTPGAITVQGSNLAVQPKKTLALIGGTVSIFGSNDPQPTQLKAGGNPQTTPGGRIELGSVLQGNVTLNPTLLGFASNYAGVENFGNIQLKNRANIDTSGISGGEIQIQARNLELSEGSRITSFTSGNFQGGNITVNASENVELIGTGDFVETLGRYASSSYDLSKSSNILLSFNVNSGNAGNIEINTTRLIVSNGFFVVNSTTGVGKSGHITVNASDSVQVINSLLTTGTRFGSIGAAGNLTINTSNLMLSEGAIVTTATAGSGKGGILTINALESVELKGGSSYELFNVPRINTDLATNAEAKGDAGDLRITTKKLTVRDGAEITATSEIATDPAGGVQMNANNQVPGAAGDIQIRSGSIELDNQGGILARSTSGNGGNITLNSQNFLLLRRKSQISTTAGTANAGGNGGNIIINTPFIIAFPNENSDITANAFSGQGGKVDINTLRNFFIAPLSRSELESRLGPSLTLNPNLLLTNDITAISQTGPTLSGQVNINTPDVDPSRGLVRLPTVVEEAPVLVSSGCAAFSDEGGSKFTITGRGGLPPSPDQPLTSDVIWTDTRLPATITQPHSSRKPSAKPHSKPKAEPVVIAPATGWVFNGKGEVTLISSAPNTSGLGTTPTSCPSQR